MRAVLIKGQPKLKSSLSADAKPLQPGAYFGSDEGAEYEIASGPEAGCLIYVRSEGTFEVLGTIPSK